MGQSSSSNNHEPVVNTGGVRDLYGTQNRAATQPTARAQPIRYGNAPPPASAGTAGTAGTGAPMRPSMTSWQPPAVTGPTSEHTGHLLLTGPLLEAVAKAVPPNYQQRWHVLYSSRTDGKNFTRMVGTTVKKGATIIVVREAGEGGRTFGAFTSTAWLTVSDREQEAKMNAAAKSRAMRDETNMASFQSRPDKQANQFYGTDDCFIFTSGDEGVGTEGTVRIHRPKHTAMANANFMYLFDTHPHKDRIGLGLGSDDESGVGNFGLFLDRYLARGSSSTRLCPTFGSPRLSATENFTIASVEVYTCDPEIVEEMAAYGAKAAGGVHGGHGDDSALSDKRAVDKALLTVHGHRFYSEEGREECC